MAARLHHDAELEQAVLGGLLLAPQALARCQDLRVEHFADDACRSAAEVILDAMGRGQPMDYAVLESELQRLGRLKECGGPAWISQLTDHCASVASIPSYAARVVDMAARRRLRSDLAAVVKSMDAGDPLSDVAGAALQAVTAASGGVRVDRCTILQAVEAIEQVQTGAAPGFLDCGFDGLNKIAPRRGQEVIVGALNSTGKTALALSVSARIAARSERVLFVSLEMSAEEVQLRRIASAARVDSEDMMRKAGISDAGWGRLAKAAGELHALKTLEVVAGSFDVAGLCGLIRAEHARTPLVAVVVDYLGLIRLKGEQRHDLELGEAAIRLKDLAKELRFALFLLAQLNRQPQAQSKEETPREPRNSDLRDSGVLEHCADVIWLLHRPGRWSECGGDEQALEVICSKRRTGRLGRASLLYHLPSQSMRDAPEDGGPGGRPYYDEGVG